MSATRLIDTAVYDGPAGRTITRISLNLGRNLEPVESASAQLMNMYCFEETAI
jgi:hypothetical protein